MALVLLALSATAGLSAPWPLAVAIAFVGLLTSRPGDFRSRRRAVTPADRQAHEDHLATIYLRAGKLVYRRAKGQA